MTSPHSLHKRKLKPEKRLAQRQKTYKGQKIRTPIRVYCPLVNQILFQSGFKRSVIASARRHGSFSHQAPLLL